MMCFHNRFTTARSGFSLKELLVVMFIISAALFLLAPALNNQHRPARRMRCQNNLKQLLLAMHNYHDIYGTLPSAMGGTGAGGNEGRLSGIVPMLSMMEYAALHEEITRGDPANGIPPGGPVPWDKNYPPWQTQLQVLQCPAADHPATDFQPTNYAFCIGDVSVDIHRLPATRGVFAPGLTSTLQEITDGTSNTIALAEIGTRQHRDVPGQYAVDLPRNVLSDPAIALRLVDRGGQTYRSDVPLHKHGRGYNWADGAAGPGLVNTILPPNGPSCAVAGDGLVDGIYSAGSYHVGGAQVGMADGSVHFIDQEIDCGNLSATPPTADDYFTEYNAAENDVAENAAAENDAAENETQQPYASPFGVWGALGTRSGREVIPQDAF